METDPNGANLRPVWAVSWIFGGAVSSWEVAHEFSGFCEELVIFGSAFFGRRFGSVGAKGSEISCDGQEHVIYHCGDCFWFLLHCAHGMGELAQGSKATFKRNAPKIHIVGECGLLHHASDEVAGNKVHPQFAFDHMRGAASQDIHLEMGFDLAEVEFDAPAPPVKIGKILSGDGCIGDGCNECHALGSKPFVDNFIADIEALGQCSEFFLCHFWSVLSGSFPIHKHIKISRLGDVRANRLTDFFSGKRIRESTPWAFNDAKEPKEQNPRSATTSAPFSRWSQRD